MKLNGMKKIVLLGIILLVLAGCFVVALKGFKVALITQKHESITLIIGKEINIKDIKDICKEVFGDKNFILRGVDNFDDAVNVRVESITNEEKDLLAHKLNEKYDTNYVGETMTVDFNSNVRIRDIIKPYVKPVVISSALIIAYILIRFKNREVMKKIGITAVVILITEAIIASVISIVRIPLSTVIINIMAVVAIAEVMIVLEHLDKKDKIASAK